MTPALRSAACEAHPHLQALVPQQHPVSQQPLVQPQPVSAIRTSSAGDPANSKLGRGCPAVKTGPAPADSHPEPRSSRSIRPPASGQLLPLPCSPVIGTVGYPAPDSLEVTMRRLFFPPAAALAVMLGSGCTESQHPTAADPATPSFGALRFPAVSFFVMGADASNSLVIQAGWQPGITPEDLCADFGAGAKEEGQKGFVVFTPPGGAHVQSMARDANLVVYRYDGGLLTDICQLVGSPVVGTGTGRFTQLLEFADPLGATAVHVTVRGTIDLVSGGQARVSGTERVTILPDGTLQFDEVRISLTPL
jgi:hypothetical protein